MGLGVRILVRFSRYYVVNGEKNTHTHTNRIGGTLSPLSPAVPAVYGIWSPKTRDCIFRGVHLYYGDADITMITYLNNNICGR